MSEILLINEIAKAKLGASSSSGGSLAAYSNFKTKVSGAGGLRTRSTESNTSAMSSSYRRLYHHGSGQFSLNGISYGSTTEVYCYPFQVNQTTGAITLGTPSATWSGSSNVDTGNWASLGDVVFRHGTGNGGNIAVGWRVVNNAVSQQTSYQDNSHQPPTNEEGLISKSGSTYYFSPSVYSTGTGQYQRVVYSYNNGSMSLPTNTNPSSNTSTNYKMHVYRQFGTTDIPHTMGAINWQNSSGYAQFDFMSNTGSLITTVSGNSLNPDVPALSGIRGRGFQLSNNTQIYYTFSGQAFTWNGSSLTDVTSSADNIPINLSGDSSSVYAVGVNEWIGMSHSTPNEIVRFTINPTTYKIQIVKSIPLRSVIGSAASMSTNRSVVALTGSTNQFLVVGILGSADVNKIAVIENPF
jgi:hypothetical protein